MSTEQLERMHESSTSSRSEPPRLTAVAPKRTNLGWFALAGIIVCAGIAGSFFFLRSGNSAAQERGGEKSDALSQEPRVQVIKPQRGGMARTTEQPGTVRAFDYAQLFTKVSGFVDKLHVDIGSQVKKDQLLAEIYDPERDAAVDQALASLVHAKAAVAQAEASIRTAEAMEQAAVAKQAEAKSVRQQMIPAREYRRKQFERFAELSKKGDIEQRVVDEEEDNFHAAEGAVAAAEAGILTAAALLGEAKAKVQLAKADAEAARARVKIADADLKLARVMVDYTKILSPYDGVVIFRGEGVHKGSFVRAASEGVGEPLLTVAAMDVMRTVVPVPDRDVAYCKVGNPATVQLDALSGKIFEAQVSRISESENVNDRTMRVEIDVKNPDHLLRDGMFGRANILLEKLIKSLTIPSSCMIERNGRGEGAVLVVRDGEVHRIDIRVGMDNGLRVEVISGLKDDDQIILQPDASIAEATKVVVELVGFPASKNAEPAHSTPPEHAPAT